MALADSINPLTASLSSWEIAGYVDVAAVAIGVAGEVIHDFTAWFKLFRWWHDKGNKASAFLLVLALVSELVIQVKTNSISGKIIAILENEAANARERAAALELEIVRIKAPRNLNQNAQEKIVGKIKTYGDISVALAEGPIEPGSEIDAQLKAIVKAAGWVLVPVSDRIMKSRDPEITFSLSDTFGIVIDFAGGRAPSKVEAAAKTLSDAISAEGVVAQSRAVADLRMEPDEIRVTVNPKPP